MIELLVVIGIIALLSSLVLVSVGMVRSKARDAQRRNDIKQITNALELYYTAHNSYPDTTASGASAPNVSWFNSIDSSWTKMSLALAPYLIVPNDPKKSSSGWPGTSGVYGYAYFSRTCDGTTNNNQHYMLVYRLENHVDQTGTGYKHCDGSSYNYAGTITIGVSAR